MRSGEAFNVVPADGELLCDMRADRSEAFDAGARRRARRARRGRPRDEDAARSGPGWTRARRPRGLLERAGARLGRPIIGCPRGGASDASHFAPHIPLTVDGLGPRGGGAHTPEEFVHAPSLRSRAEVALAVAVAVLDS